MRFLLVNLHYFTEQTESWLSSVVGQPVLIGGIDSNWSGWTLVMRFRNVQVLDQADETALLDLDNARIAIDVWNSLLERRLTPGKLVISGARLLVLRRADGSFAAKALEPGRAIDTVRINEDNDQDTLVQWILAQGKLDLESASLVWDDQRSSSPPIELSDMSLQFRVDTNRYRLTGEASLPEDLGARLGFDIDIDGNPFSRHWSGSASLTAPGVLVAGLPRRENPDRKLRGALDIDLDSRWRNGLLEQFTGRVDINDVTLQKSSEFAAFDRGRLTIEGKRKADDWSISTTVETLETPNGHWPPTNGTIDVEQRADGTRRISGGLGFARITDIAPVLLAFVPAAWGPDLQSMRLSGTLTDLDFDTVMDGTDLSALSVDVNVQNLAFPSRQHLPGVAGLSGRLNLTRTHGTLTVDSPNLRAEVPGVFSKPIDTAMSGNVTWVRRGTGWWFDTSGLEFGHSAFSALLTGRVHWPYQNRVPILDVAVTDVRADLQYLHEYLPVGLMQPSLARWLQRSITAGEMFNGELRFKGYGGDFPFDGPEGGFSGRAEVRDVELAYSASWPKLEAMNGSLTLEEHKLTITPVAATVYGASYKSGQAVIDDLGAETPVVRIEGLFQGELVTGLEFLRKGRLRERFGPLVQGVDGSGPIDILLALDIPVPSGERQVKGRVALKGNELHFTGFNTRFENSTGHIDFTQDGVRADNINATYLGKPIVVDAAPHPEDSATTRITIKGEADNTFLIQQLHALELFANPADPPRIMSRVHGKADWTAELDLPPDWGQADSEAALQVRSGLRGLELDLPAPFHKQPDDPGSLSVSTRLSSAPSREVRIVYGDHIGSVFRLTSAQTGFELDRGAVVFGDVTPSLPEKRGLHISGQLDRFSLDNWREVTRDDPTSEQGPEPKELDDYPLLRVLEEVEVRASSVELLGQSFDNTHVMVKREEFDGWHAKIRGEAVAGTVFFPNPSAEPKPIQVDLDTLKLSSNEDQTESGDPSRLPPFKFSCRQLFYRDIDIGAVKLSATPIEDGLNIDSWLMIGPGYEASSKGSWRYANGEHQTKVVTEVSADRLSALLKLVDYEGGAEDGATELTLNLHWNDTPANVSLAGLNGVVHMRSNRGRLLNVNPGAAGRLFGSLMLTSLPRRLKLDFKDVFGEGIEFDFIEGSFGLANGHAYTNNLQLESESARIEIAGRTGLVREDYDQIVTVTPRLSSSLPLAPVWLLEKVLKKSVFDKAFAYRYTITGPWAEPNIDRVIVETSNRRDDDE